MQCLLITVTKCLKGHTSLGLLFERVPKCLCPRHGLGVSSLSFCWSGHVSSSLWSNITRVTRLSREYNWQYLRNTLFGIREIPTRFVEKYIFQNLILREAVLYQIGCFCTHWVKGSSKKKPGDLTVRLPPPSLTVRWFVFFFPEGYIWLRFMIMTQCEIL